MKLADIITEAHGNQENQTLHKAPAVGGTGDWVTTSQAARILGLKSPSRIRQLIASGKLKAKAPEKGRRDTLISLAAVKRLKKTMDHKPGPKAKKKPLPSQQKKPV